MDELTKNPIIAAFIGIGIAAGIAVPIMSYVSKFIGKHLPEIKKDEKKPESDDSPQPDAYQLLTQMMLQQQQRDLTRQDQALMRRLEEVQAELTETRHELLQLKAQRQRPENSSPVSPFYDTTIDFNSED